jgi:hypothetical protein
MATEQDLQSRGFQSCRVTAKALNVDHADPAGRGPFCRLVVEDTAPTSPGAYAWTRSGSVMYVGKVVQVRQVVHGSRMQRAYNDHTYIPASKVGQLSNPRVRVNGLLNAALCEGLEVAWWWVETGSVDEAVRLEARLINEWNPPWNRAHPIVK